MVYAFFTQTAGFKGNSYVVTPNIRSQYVHHSANEAGQELWDNQATWSKQEALSSEDEALTLLAGSGLRELQPLSATSRKGVDSFSWQAQ